MTHSKALSWIVLLLSVVIFLYGGSLSFGDRIRPDFQQQEEDVQKQKAKDAQVEEEKEKKVEKKEEDLGEAMKKRVEEGESILEVVGIHPEDYLPGPFEIALLWLIPFSVIVGVVVLILIVTKRRHQRILAMIEKGILPDASSIKEFRAVQFRWDVILLLTGLVLGLGGIGLSLFMMGHKGPDQWYAGTIPFLIGAALLGFYLIFYKKKKE